MTADWFHNSNRENFWISLVSIIQYWILHKIWNFLLFIRRNFVTAPLYVCMSTYMHVPIIDFIHHLCMYALYLYYFRTYKTAHNISMKSHTPIIQTVQTYQQLRGNKEMDALSSRSVLIMATTTEREKYLGLFRAGSVDECDYICIGIFCL